MPSYDTATGDYSTVDPAEPVDWGHPLNAGRVVWLFGLPGRVGAKWFDLAGSNHGTLTNGPTSTPTPRGDSGLTFNGSSNYVVTSGGGERLLGDMSLAAWFRPANANASEVKFVAIAGNDAYGQRRGILQRDSRVEFNGEFADVSGAFGTLASGVWSRLVVTARTANGSIAVYVNGALYASGTRTLNAFTNYTLHVGSNNSGGEVTSGTVADVSAWSRLLTPADVRADYDLSRQGYPGVLRRARPAAWFVGSPGGGFVPLVSGLGW